MRSIEKLHHTLTRQKIPFIARGNCITVEPTAENGFRVTLIDDGREPTVHFDFWGQRCSSAEEAEQLFMLGLSKRCRLRVLCAQGKALCWTLQVRDGVLWRAGAVTGQVPARMDAVDTVYLQNDHIAEPLAAPVAKPQPQPVLAVAGFNQMMLEGGI